MERVSRDRSTRGSWRQVGAFVLAFVFGGLLVANPAAAADDPVVTWGVRPVDDAQGEPRANYSYELSPGQVVEDTIVVYNHDEKPLTLKVYAADGFVSASGQLDLVAGGEESTDLGAWVSLAQGEVTIQPGEGVEVPFTLAVPVDATPGDHTGGIVTSLSVPGDDAAVNVERRLGSRMHVRVAGPLQPAVAISDLTVQHPGSTDVVPVDTATVGLTVENTGNVRVNGSLTLSLAAPFGLWERDVPLDDLPELLPGSTSHVEVEVPDVPASVVVTGTLTVDPTAVVPDGAEPGPEPGAVTASTWGWAPPWIPLAVLALVGAWLVRVLVRRRRLRRAAKRAAAAAETPTTGDADGVDETVGMGSSVR